MSTIRVPKCYGLLFSDTECAHCLIGMDCKKATTQPRVVVEREEAPQAVPTDKKQLILAVCAKFGIPTRYTPKGKSEPIEVTLENVETFFNLDFLITSKDALTRFFQIPLAGGGEEVDV